MQEGRERTPIRPQAGSLPPLPHPPPPSFRTSPFVPAVLRKDARTPIVSSSRSVCGPGGISWHRDERAFLGAGLSGLMELVRRADPTYAGIETFLVRSSRLEERGK